MTWTPRGVEWEADPRHAELVIRACGVTGAKVTTPGVKERAEDAETEDIDLGPEEAALYRSVAMRASYLSQDRPDLQFACRELAKGMSKPTERHWMARKRLARYLRAKPRLVQLFPLQDGCAEMVCWTDRDHAGCVRTRKSVSGGVVMFGACTIHTYSKGQAVVSLSSGESEYYGLVSGMSCLLGEASLAADWGVKLTARIFMDASAGIGIGSRRGLGRVKHIDTVFLWCQQMVTDGRVKVTKKSTTEMLADVLTKHVPEVLMVQMLKGMGFAYQVGKHDLSFRI